MYLTLEKKTEMQRGDKSLLTTNTLCNIGHVFVVRINYNSKQFYFYLFIFILFLQKLHYPETL